MKHGNERFPFQELQATMTPMKNVAFPLALALTFALSACAPARGNLGAAGNPLAPSGGDDAGAWFLLHSPTLSDANGDGVWSPGEQLTLGFLFTNQRGDHYAYPGTVASTDVSEVVVSSSENWWYGIDAGGTYEAWVTFTPDADLSEGTIVTLINEAAALNCDQPGNDEQWCPDPNPLLVPVRLGAELPTLQ
ncbi:MAG: hypothetical protein KDA24_19115 [Deltaproteobacteria bacterium]|nr:hypothetical protein [Deltaproteobacteria bacterium]